MSFGKKEIDWLLREKYPEFISNPKKYLPEIYRDLKRLKNSEPLSYVIGWINFLGCKIDLSFKPFIPRPETEWWTEKVIKVVNNKPRTKNQKIKALDIFAGSGCIGIAFLKYVPQAEVWFGDNDCKSLKQIRKNLKLNNISAKRYRIKQTDVFENINTKFDYIFANPPYIPTVKKSKLPISVQKYEKAQALFGGKDGLQYIQILFAQAKNYLLSDGELWLEFDSGQAPAVRKIAEKEGFRCEINKDQFCHLRYARCHDRN